MKLCNLCEETLYIHLKTVDILGITLSYPVVKTSVLPFLFEQYKRTGDTDYLPF